VDWKPERVVQEKVRDFQNKRKIKQKAWLLRRANGGTLCVGLQMTTSSRLWVNNELSPQKTSVATLYQVLPRQRLDWFTIIPSPRMFVECCTAMSVRLPSYLFCLVSSSSPVICNYIVAQSSTVYTVIQITFIHTNHIRSYKSHSFIQITFVHTNHVHSYNYTFIHGCISHPKSCLVVSFRFSLQIVSSCQS